MKERDSWIAEDRGNNLSNVRRNENQHGRVSGQTCDHRDSGLGCVMDVRAAKGLVDNGDPRPMIGEGCRKSFDPSDLSEIEALSGTEVVRDVHAREHRADNRTFHGRRRNATPHVREQYRHRDCLQER
jgi:hypothetical protein